MAHGGAGLIQHPQQGALFLLAPEGLSKLQVTPGSEIQLHVPLLSLQGQRAQVAQIGLLGLSQIGGQSSGGPQTQLLCAVILLQLVLIPPQPASSESGQRPVQLEAVLPAVFAHALQPLPQEDLQRLRPGGLAGEDRFAGRGGG